MFAAHDLPDGVEPSLDADATFDPENFSFPHGTHLCAVEVDTETGEVKIRNYVCVDDVGKVVNPLIVEGQVHGGLVQGIAQALFEEAVYDESGHPGDRLVRRLPACRAPPTCRRFTTERTETPATTNPLGSRASARPARSPRLRPSSTRSSTRCGTCGIKDIADAVLAAPGLDRRSRHAAASEGGDVMIPRTVRLHRARRRWPTRIARCGGDADEIKVLAGGQSLIPVLQAAAGGPTLIVDLGRIDELQGVSDDGDAIVIGAMTTHDEVASNPLVAEHAPCWRRRPQTVADPQVRHRGTLGGSLVHADPAGDLPAPIAARSTPRW